MFKKSLITYIIGLVLLIITVSCSESSTKVDTENPVNVTGISLNQDDISILVGQTYTLVAIVEPPNATNKNVSWSSNSPNIATVSSQGVVTAHSLGTANIIVTTTDGGFTAICTTTVIASGIPATGVSLDMDTVTLEIGENITLIATIEPDNATNKNVSWSSSNQNIATVSSQGTVTAIAQGSAIITVITEDGSFSDTCQITVTEAGNFYVSNAAEWTTAVNTIRNQGNNKDYNIYVIGDFSLPGLQLQQYTFGSITGLTVNIIGNHTISLSSSSQGSLIIVGSNQSIIIKDISFIGRSNNNQSVVLSLGNLTLEGSASISGNSTAMGGAGVHIFGGTFTMKDTASVFGNNSIGNGGGVSIEDTSVFIMRDSSSIHNNICHWSGGGAFINGSFTMLDNASIYENTAQTAGGGGVFIIGLSVTFTIKGNASIARNNALGDIGYGGGVRIFEGPFYMQENASIYGNSASQDGGGLDIWDGTFIMSGGAIYGNQATGAPTQFANTAAGIGAALNLNTNFGAARYGNGSNILPHHDGNSSMTNYTINGR